METPQNVLSLICLYLRWMGGGFNVGAPLQGQKPLGMGIFIQDMVKGQK